MSGIDLHTHTTSSDGTCSPRGLIDLASIQGLEAVAITDHDTVAGCAEALARGRTKGIEVIPGVEFSVDHPHLPDHGSFHLLGLFLDPEFPMLGRTLDVLRRKRKERALGITNRLDALNMPISAEEIERMSSTGAVGRPHIALQMVRMGYVSSLREAFDGFLSRGAPAHVPREKLEVTQAMHLIRSAGGLPVLAHPFSLCLEAQALEMFLVTLRGLGLEAIEAYYPDHTPEQTEHCLSLARSLDLAVSGGSDFHGDTGTADRSHAGLGIPMVPYGIIRGLRERLP